MNIEHYIKMLETAGLRDIKLMAATQRNYIFDAGHAKYGRVAVKVPKLGNGKKLKVNVDPKSYLNEFHLSNGFSHPNIVKVFEIINLEGEIPALIEEKGEYTLRELLKKNTKFPLCFSLKIALGLLRALKLIHDKGYVYGDLKPENVIVDKYGNPKIIDLETLKPKVSPPGLTTVDYATPEQFLNAKVLPETDVYQVALILHEILTGYMRNPAFSEELIIKEPAWLKELLTKALTRNPKERISLKDFLNTILKHYSNLCRGNEYNVFDVK